MSNIKEELKQLYPYRIELHAHTSPVSNCSQISPREMAETYYNKGYDAVVITNHFYSAPNESKNEKLDWYLSDYEATKSEAEKYNLKVLLGAEIRFWENSNDYLIFGVDREILSICYDYLEKGIIQFRNEVKLPDSIFIQAHPFRNNMELVNPDLLDGIEIYNMHPNHNSRVALATRYAKENNIAIKTIGSDFHHPGVGHEAVSALRTKILPTDSFELAKILRSGDYIFEIGEDSIVLP